MRTLSWTLNTDSRSMGYQHIAFCPILWGGQVHPNHWQPFLPDPFTRLIYAWAFGRVWLDGMLDWALRLRNMTAALFCTGGGIRSSSACWGFFLVPLPSFALTAWGLSIPMVFCAEILDAGFCGVCGVLMWLVAVRLFGSWLLLPQSFLQVKFSPSVCSLSVCVAGAWGNNQDLRNDLLGNLTLFSPDIYHVYTSHTNIPRAPRCLCLMES